MPKVIYTDPKNSDNFGDNYPKVCPFKKTLFIDLDDTLVHVSLYKDGS